jgi:GWxTD domain-containing protein
LHALIITCQSPFQGLLIFKDCIVTRFAQTRLLLLLFLTLLAQPSVYAAQEPHQPTDAMQEACQQGIAMMESGDVDEAVKVLEEVTTKDHKYAQAYNALAEAYMARNTLHDRIKAERVLKQALYLDFKNVVYNINLGKLRLLQGLPLSAREQFDKTLKLNPEAIQAYFELGRLQLKSALENDYLISLNNSDDIVAYYDVNAMAAATVDGALQEARLERKAEQVDKLDDVFRQEMKKDLRAARRAFQQVLTVLPEDRDANYYMGMLAFFREDYKNVARFMRTVVMNNPDDIDGYMLMGLALTQMKEYDMAWAMYEKAKILMTPDDRREFESIAFIEPDSLNDDMTETERDIAVRRFWRSQDPLYITDYNERELAHYSRFVEANLRFSVEANTNSTGIKAIPGWKTNRGAFFIKYGRPEQWWKLRNEIPEVTERFGTDWTVIDKRGLELWQYPQFMMGFWDPYSSGKSVYAESEVFPGMDFFEEAHVIQDEIHQAYIPDYRPRQFGMPYTVTQFRGEPGSTDLHISFGLPARKMRFLPDEQGYAANLNRGIFFFDEQWRIQLQDVQNVTIRSGPQFNVKRREMYPAVQTVRVRPGKYNLSIEVEEKLERNTGVVRELFEAREFRQRGLQLSDMLFAEDITPPENIEVSKRADFTIKPDLDKVYTVFHPVFLYYEIYGLIIDPTTQSTRYRVECAIELQEQKRTGIWQYFPSIAQSGQSAGRIETVAEYSGITSTEHQYLRINVENSPPGDYRVTLNVEDQVTGDIVTGESYIQLSPLTPREEGEPSLDPNVLRDGLHSLNVSPDNPLTHYHLGVIYYNAGSLETAIREYNAALEISPDLEEAYYGLALAYRDQGKVGLALQAAQNVRDLNDDEVLYRQLTGAMEAALGNYEECLETLETDKNDVAPILKFAFAQAVHTPGTVLQAAEHYNLAAIDNPDFPEAHHEFGRTLQQLGRMGDAQGWNTTAKIMDPRFAPEYLGRRYPELVEPFAKDAKDSLMTFVDVAMVNGDTDSTQMMIGFLAEYPTELHGKKAEYSVRVTLFDARWTAKRAWTQEYSAELENDNDAVEPSWGDGLFEINSAPGRYYLTFLVHEKKTNRYSYLVRKVLVPYIGEGGLAIPEPILDVQSSKKIFPWYSVGDKLQVQLNIPQHLTADAHSIQWEVKDLLKQDKFILKKVVTGMQDRNTYAEGQLGITDQIDGFVQWEIILQKMPAAVCFLNGELKDANGHSIAAFKRILTVGQPLQEIPQKPVIFPLLRK